MTTPAGAVAGNAAQAQREAAAREKPGDGFFARKYGPLPGWGWALLAAGGALAYFWWRKRSLAQNTSTGTSYTGSTTGSVEDQLMALQDEIDALQGELATTGTGTTTGQPPPEPKPVHQVVVPKVVGMRATPAVARLKAAGLKAHSTPPRKAGEAQKVVSQTPAAGKHVESGSTVDLHLEKVTRR